MMVHFGKFIAKHRSLIFLLSLLLLIPSALGYIATRINYDVLSYLPDTLETVAGQDILVDEFGMGAFSMVIVENMEHQDVVRLEETIEGIDHVKDVLWYDDILDISVPEMMLPSDLKDALFTENSTMMIALFDQTTSADETMDAISTMRAEVGKECFISGMSGIVTDIKNLALKEMPVYVLPSVHARSDADAGVCLCAGSVSDQHRYGSHLQSWQQHFPGTDLLHHPGTDCCTPVRRHYGLLHLPAEQL